MRFYHNEMPAYIIYCKFLNVEFLMLNIFYILQILEGVYISLYRNWFQKCNFSQIQHENPVQVNLL